MEQGSYWGITSVSKGILEAAVAQNGRLPDNFVDSGEGVCPVPDYRDPAARRLLERVDAAVTELIERRQTGEGEHRPAGLSAS